MTNKKEEIKYDGSDAEMMRLGLINEMGEINNKMRNEYNQYMARVWAKEHPNEKSPYAEKYPSREETEEYMHSRAEKNQDEIKRRGFLRNLFGRKK